MTPKQWKRLFLRTVLWAGMGIAFLLLIFLVQAVWRVYGAERQARQAHIDEADAYADLTARQQTLSTELASLGTDRGMEAEVRDRYPVVRSGEEVIVLTSGPQTASSASETASTTVWGTILSWFSWL